MLSPDAARRIIEKHVDSLGSETVPLRSLCGRVPVKNVKALRDNPAFDNAQMDGFAVLSSDLRGAGPETPALLKIAGVAKAGTKRKNAVRRGLAVKIMTGAPLPEGADCVVMKEETREMPDGFVRIFSRGAPGQFVRRRGSDVKKNAVVVPKGAILNQYHIAALAVAGHTSVPVVRRPAVAVITTGAELLAGVCDANAPSLCAALEKYGAAAVFCGTAGDDENLLASLIRKAIVRSGMLIVSGGVSVGDFDFTKPVLERCGMKTLFWRTAMKPGKPVLFGLLRGKPVFGLPGNPVSSLVAFDRFVVPALRKMSGAAVEDGFPLRGAAANDFPHANERHQFLFCHARGDRAGKFQLDIIPSQNSGSPASLSSANALASVPPGTAVRRGDSLDFKFLP